MIAYKFISNLCNSPNMRNEYGVLTYAERSYVSRLRLQSYRLRTVSQEKRSPSAAVCNISSKNEAFLHACQQKRCFCNTLDTRYVSRLRPQSYGLSTKTLFLQHFRHPSYIIPWFLQHFRHPSYIIPWFLQHFRHPSYIIP